jgi:hypothetical protein
MLVLAVMCYHKRRTSLISDCGLLTVFLADQFKLAPLLVLCLAQPEIASMYHPGSIAKFVLHRVPLLQNLCDQLKSLISHVHAGHCSSGAQILKDGPVKHNRGVRNPIEHIS